MNFMKTHGNLWGHHPLTPLRPFIRLMLCASQGLWVVVTGGERWMMHRRMRVVDSPLPPACRRAEEEYFALFPMDGNGNGFFLRNQIGNKHHKKENHLMKIAVTCENNEVFQHFGHTPEFAIFTAEGGKILEEKRLSSGDSGHGALATLLADEEIDVLICGGIGGGAINALTQLGIQVVGGAEGSVREAAQAFLNGSLKARSDFRCNHHHHGGEGEEGPGSHSCGNHSHGCGNHSRSCGG